MITIDAPISFLLGTGIALATISADSTKQQIQQNLLYGFILQSCILSPIILFFMLRFPDWEWNYLFNAKQFFFSEQSLSLGAASIALIMAILNATYLLGFKLSEHFLLNNKKNTVIAIISATLISVLAIMAIMFKQTLNIGSLAEFQAETTTLIFMNTDFLIAQTSAGVLLAIGFIIIMKTSKSSKLD